MCHGSYALPDAVQCASPWGGSLHLVCMYHVAGSRCTNSKYLEGGACVDACVSGSPVGSDTDGRECN